MLQSKEVEDIKLFLDLNGRLQGLQSCGKDCEDRVAHDLVDEAAAVDDRRGGGADAQVQQFNDLAWRGAFGDRRVRNQIGKEKGELAGLVRDRIQAGAGGAGRTGAQVFGDVLLHDAIGAYAFFVFAYIDLETGGQRNLLDQHAITGLFRRAQARDLTEHPFTVGSPQESAVVLEWASPDAFANKEILKRFNRK